MISFKDICYLEIKRKMVFRVTFNFLKFLARYHPRINISFCQFISVAFMIYNITFVSAHSNISHRTIMFFPLLSLVLVSENCLLILRFIAFLLETQISTLGYLRHVMVSHIHYYDLIVRSFSSVCDQYAIFRAKNMCRALIVRR